MKRILPTTFPPADFSFNNFFSDIFLQASRQPVLRLRNTSSNRSFLQYCSAATSNVYQRSLQDLVLF
jgi:hypothetical protein